jgi:hypothetical protein
MSRREDIDNGIWSDPDFEALSLDATALYLWSFTNPRCGMAGLYKVSRRAMTESKVPDERLDAALEELAAANFAYFQDGVLLVRSRVKHLRQRTVQIAKSIARDVAKVADGHPMRTRFLEEYGRDRWLREALYNELQATVEGDSPEGHGVGSLEPFSSLSGEGHSTLQGKGNGKGTGKGPLGRGVGREDASAATWQWARDHFPDLPSEVVISVARQVHDDGIEVTPATVAERYAEYFPEEVTA